MKNKKKIKKYIKPFFIWSGVYSTFKESQNFVEGSHFKGKKYINNAKKEYLKIKNYSLKNDLLFSQSTERYKALSYLCLNQSNNKKINILDFGGGFGTGLLLLNNTLPKNILKKINYHIVDNKELIKTAKKINNKIHFQDKLIIKKYNIIASSSCLQYIEDWKKLLNDFANLRPNYIYLSDLFIGNIDSFVTLQNYYNSKIPHWFINKNILINHLKTISYNLECKEICNVKRLDSKIINMSNFHYKKRIKHTWNLLFKLNN